MTTNIDRWIYLRDLPEYKLYPSWRNACNEIIKLNKETCGEE